MKKVLVTNVTQYTGPGVVEQLVPTGYQVICHDRSFSDELHAMLLPGIRM